MRSPPRWWQASRGDDTPSRSMERRVKHMVHSILSDGSIAEAQSLVIVRRNGSRHSVLFDAVDADLIARYRWSVACNPTVTYARTRTREGRVLYMHALLAGPGADHINRNGLDNRRVNLRPATVAQNCRNRGPRPGTSRFKGVSLSHGRWMAQLASAESGYLYLGRYDTEEQAALAYDLAALALWGEYAYLNFPNGATA